MRYPFTYKNGKDTPFKSKNNTKTWMDSIIIMLLQMDINLDMDCL